MVSDGLIHVVFKVLNTITCNYLYLCKNYWSTTVTEECVKRNSNSLSNLENARKRKDMKRLLWLLFTLDIKSGPKIEGKEENINRRKGLGSTYSQNRTIKNDNSYLDQEINNFPRKSGGEQPLLKKIKGDLKKAIQPITYMNNKQKIENFVN